MTDHERPLSKRGKSNAPYMGKILKKEKQQYVAAAANIRINLEDDDDNGNIFYDAIANAFDHSQTVRKYFHDDRSKTQSDNKRLWLLRYQSYKEFGI